MLKFISLLILSSLTSCSSISALGESESKPFRVIFVKPNRVISARQFKKLKVVKNNRRVKTEVSSVSRKLSSIKRKKITKKRTRKNKTQGKTKTRRSSYKPFKPSQIYKFGSHKLKFSKKTFDFWVKYFSKRSRARFKRFQRNGLAVQNIVRATMKKHGLPEDLFYVGMIESGYYSGAKSHASAVGPWQFIKGTGSRYGLRIDRSVDERRNIYKATEAAAKYFKDLYNIFGSWDLAMAAYNAGEYRIINAIRKGGTRSFRELVAKNLLPKETAAYVPKVMAAKYVLENSKRFGFRFKNDLISIYDNVHRTRLKYPFSLKAIANKTNIPYSLLKKLNSDINHKWTHVSKRRAHDIYLPKDIGKGKIYKRLTQKNPYIGNSMRKYKVSKGDSLLGLAYKFDVSLSELKRVNKLTKNSIRVGQRLIIPVVTKSKIHIVRKGESVFRIAKKYGVRLSHIFRANNIKNGKIFPGQKIVVPVDI